MKHACVYVALLSPKTLMRRHTVIKRPHGFSFTIKCTFIPTTGLFVCSAHPKTNKRCFFILLDDSTVDVKPLRVTMKCVWYIGALPKLINDRAYLPTNTYGFCDGRRHKSVTSTLASEKLF